MRLAQRLLLESTRPCIPVQKSIADAFALALVRRTPEELTVVLDQLIHMYQVMLYVSSVASSYRVPVIRIFFSNFSRLLAVYHIPGRYVFLVGAQRESSCY